MKTILRVKKIQCYALYNWGTGVNLDVNNETRVVIFTAPALVSA